MLRRRVVERRRGMTVLPDSVDWRTAEPPVLTAPKDQGACGSCWTFSGTGKKRSRKGGGGVFCN